MELFREPKINWIRLMPAGVVLSLVLLAATILSLALRGGPKWGIDFRGGTLVYVKFGEQPPLEQIRRALIGRVPGEVTVQEMTGAREVIIGTEMRSEQELDLARRMITETLAERFAPEKGKVDLNNAGREALAERLREPLQRAGVNLSEPQLQELAGRIVDFRDGERSGLLTRFEELAAVPGVTPPVLEVLKREATLAPFTIRQVEIVGPKVGADLRQKALMATLYALAGMLVYIAFRFEFVAGIGAVVASFHDALITIGVFSWLDREISLTVIAAILTLIGYSINDTIVVFDRVRENLKLRFREALPEVVNRSVNQTLTRTVMTSGTTLAAVLALYFLGGPVLNSMALALLVGVIVGTYSSIFVASAIVVGWHNVSERRKKAAGSAAAAPVSKAREAARKVGRAAK
jgi:preprotein translocase subunit SecF